ncbi:hypothetical protein WK62_27765 [Burkholderia ubonensis]|uniref:hypothetical protein n=1 Tax=Burkholderia ubonensis TaxID=101571 RepID=UPI00075536C5|nr:hypothetical protein [Burkholderia ubonensis]KVU15677.1 hypothetical protein WK62_27765 [Burkholderia ubonensis]
MLDRERKRTHPRITQGQLVPFEPTHDQRMTVRIMAACGMKIDMIVQQVTNPDTGLAIDAKTLRKYFAKDLKDGREVANAMVAQSLFKKAIGNSPQAVTACIFWLRSQAGWLAPDSIEISGKDGKPLTGAERQQLVVYLPDNGRDAANGKGDGPQIVKRRG